MCTNMGIVILLKHGHVPQVSRELKSQCGCHQQWAILTDRPRLTDNYIDLGTDRNVSLL